MEDDLISGLTRQVKEEVIGNYLRERRIVELQIENVQKMAAETIAGASLTGRRLARLGLLLMMDRRESQKLSRIFQIPEPSYWAGCMRDGSSIDVPAIRVRAFTEKAKFRKLLIEAYSRFCRWMANYAKQYESFEAECRAVNSNIVHFRRNFDLLAILTFLRNLDVRALEKKQVLGDNFTAREIASAESALTIRPISIETLNVPIPLALPPKETVKPDLEELAGEIYREYGPEIGKLIR